VVLRRGPDHRRPADVDLLDDGVGLGPRPHGLDEGIEVHDDEVEGLDLELRQLVDVLLAAAIGQDARVHLRVQGLDPTVEGLLEAGHLGHLGDGHTGRGDALRRRTGGHDGHARAVQALRELLQTGLVEHRDQGSADGDTVEVGQAHADLRHIASRGVASKSIGVAHRPPGKGGGGTVLAVTAPSTKAS
jgi:hypothetical protein